MEQLFIREMNETFAEEILDWKYEPPYDFYNSDSTEELLAFPYYSIVDHKDKMIGFFCIGQSAQVPIGTRFGAYSEELVDLGIGMKPELTGKGNGAAFFSFVLSTIQAKSNKPIRLTVAKFNKRAIHLYEKFGFVKKMEFSNGPTEFITMVKDF